MSGIETVKIIVDAEKQAAKIIDEAKAQAAAIRKGISALVQEQRTQMLTEAKREAADIAAHAGEEGKLEAEKFESESMQALQAVVARASRRKDATVEKLLTLVMQVD